MEEKIRKQRYINARRSLLLFAGMLGLMIALGYSFFGATGMILAGIFGIFLLYLSTRIPTKLIMQMYRARPVSQGEAPNLYAIVNRVSRQAQLERMPQIYFIADNTPNAFATGGKKDPAVALTQGLIQTLTPRELMGVVAHEISHITNHDMQLLGAMNAVGRLTHFFAFMGKILLLVNLPLFLMGEAYISWWAIVLLLVAPLLTNFMMLAISRTREYDADLEAARLTGDPLGLAHALEKLYYYQKKNAVGFVRVQPPESMSSHPKMQERIRRLQELAPRYEPRIAWSDIEQLLFGPSRISRTSWF